MNTLKNEPPPRGDGRRFNSKEFEESKSSPGFNPAPRSRQSKQRPRLPFMGREQQLQYFAGCCYVRNNHKIMIPSGELLGRDKFRSLFRGYEFEFEPSGKTSRCAWTVFTRSLVLRFPKVRAVMFRPDLDQGAGFERNGTTYINTHDWRSMGMPAARALRFCHEYLRDDELVAWILRIESGGSDHG